MADDPNFWRTLIAHRPPEVWIALTAGAAYVFQKSAQRTMAGRVIEAGISGGIGYAVGPDAAAWAGINGALAAILVSALGYLALDVLTSLVADRAMVKEIILRRLGGGNGKPDA